MSEASKTVVQLDKEQIQLVIDEMALAYPYGAQKYTDADVAPILQGEGALTLGALRFAHTLVIAWQGSPLIPKWVANSPNPAGTWVAGLIRAKELGFKPLEGMGALFLSPDGRIGMYGASMIALMRRSGFKLKFTELKDSQGKPNGMEVYGKRPGEDGDEYTSTFTRADAALAQLKGQHDKYPLWMCKWRAVSDLFRTLAADLSGGPLYSTEELQEEAVPEREAPLEPEQRRQMRAEVLDNKLTELKKGPVQDVEVVESEVRTPIQNEPCQCGHRRGLHANNSEKCDSCPCQEFQLVPLDIEHAAPVEDAEPTLFDDAEPEPEWAEGLKSMYLKLTAAGRLGFIKDTLSKFNLEKIEDVTEENAMGVIADFEDHLRERPIKPLVNKPKGGFKL